jgi:hypothetical protein
MLTEWLCFMELVTWLVAASTTPEASILMCVMDSIKQDGSRSEVHQMCVRFHVLIASEACTACSSHLSSLHVEIMKHYLIFFWSVTCCDSHVTIQPADGSHSVATAQSAVKHHTPHPPTPLDNALHPTFQDVLVHWCLFLPRVIVYLLWLCIMQSLITSTLRQLLLGRSNQGEWDGRDM